MMGAPLFMLFIAWLGYHHGGGRFRATGLSERTGASRFVWVLDSPVSPTVGVGLMWAAILWRAPPGSWCVAAASLAMAVLSGATAIAGLVRRKLHPYSALTVVLMVLVLTGNAPAALIVCAVALLVSQGYEDRLWRSIGKVSVWGRGALTWQEAQGVANAELDLTTVLCITLLVDCRWTGGLVSMVFVLGYIVLIRLCPWVRIHRPMRSLTVPGLPAVQAKLAMWTVYGFSERTQPGGMEGGGNG
jgi:hypothetical protein